MRPGAVAAEERLQLLRVLSAEQWAARSPPHPLHFSLSPFHVCGADLSAASGKCKLTNVQSACEVSFA